MKLFISISIEFRIVEKEDSDLNIVEERQKKRHKSYRVSSPPTLQTYYYFSMKINLAVLKTTKAEFTLQRTYLNVLHEKKLD